MSSSTNPSLESQLLQAQASQAPSSGGATYQGGTSWFNQSNGTLNPAGGTNEVAEVRCYTTNLNHFSEWLIGTNIQWVDQNGNPFTFPSSAIITSVQLDVYITYVSGNSAVYGEFSLAGVNAQAVDNGPWGSNGTYHFTFGVNSLWGTTITPAILNSSTFGWKLRVICTQQPATGADFVVNNVTLTVTYATVTTPTAPAEPALRGDQCFVFNVTGAHKIIGPAQIVQSAYAPNNGGSLTVTLNSSPTPGNTLVAIASFADPYEQPSLGLPSGFTSQADFEGQPYNGAQWNCAKIGTRVVQSGDGVSWTFTSGGNSGGVRYFTCFIFELEGSCNLACSAGCAGSGSAVTSLSTNTPTLTGVELIICIFTGWNIAISAVSPSMTGFYNSYGENSVYAPSGLDLEGPVTATCNQESYPAYALVVGKTS
jgi:hypothetical protein